MSLVCGFILYGMFVIDLYIVAHISIYCRVKLLILTKTVFIITILEPKVNARIANYLE